MKYLWLVIFMVLVSSVLAQPSMLTSPEMPISGTLVSQLSIGPYVELKASGAIVVHDKNGNKIGEVNILNHLNKEARGAYLEALRSARMR